MKLSIIIPVYNSEKYLPQCVDSILQQTYTNLEVILVDDESPDSCPKLCEDYAKHDERVVVIHKENGGTADSRNEGLKIATGDYVTFIDNDDYWKKKTAIAEIMAQLSESKADVLMFDTMNYWENTGTFELSQKFCSRRNVVGEDKSTALREIMEHGLLYRAVWAKVIRRDLIVNHRLYFTRGLRNEDTEWTAKLLLCAKTYDWYEDVFYVYRKATQAAQTDKRVTYKEVSDLKTICKRYILLGKKELRNDPKYLQLYLGYLAYPFAVWMGQSNQIKDPRIKADQKEMKPYAFVLRYDTDPAVKLVKKVYRFLGYKLTSWVLTGYLEYGRRKK